MTAPAAERPSVIDILAQHGHFPVRKRSNFKNAFGFRCPFHSDSRPSFWVTGDEQLWNCWTCGGGGVAKLLQLFGDNYVAPPKPAPAPKKSSPGLDEPLQGCTLAQVAKAKAIPPEHLRNLGWYDTKHRYQLNGQWTTCKAVAIPYASSVQLRVGLDQGQRFKWEYGHPENAKELYGIEWILPTDKVVLAVEGTTDVAAARYMRIPAVGIPGTSIWKANGKKWAKQLEGHDLVVWKEPDEAGQNMVEAIVQDIPDIKVIHAPDAVKDVVELLDQSGSGAEEWLRELMAEAEPYLLPGQEAEHQPFEGAGEGRHRFTGTKGAEIRQSRDRLGKIWLEAHHRLGDDDAIARANNCGGLWGRECANGHITAPEEKERLNCKQRLHPRCLGTNARKAFYLPKSRGPTRLDDEGDMDIHIVQLGRFDIGEDLFLWGPNIRRQIEFVRKHIGKLRRHKDAPQSFRDSFIGWRVDLRKGCLTLDLVIAGGRDPAMSEWLKEAFAEVASETVKVETLHPLDHSGVINDFGNLMSSAVFYSDVEECLAMLEALKGWRLVQPQGKFLGKKAVAEDRCQDVSIGDTPKDPVETSRHPASSAGGGATHPPCPECGLPTWSAGFKTGHWSKGVGSYSKQLAWRLLADDADPGGGPGEGFQDFRGDLAQAREEVLI